jgi:hypothetical protein
MQNSPVMTRTLQNQMQTTLILAAVFADAVIVGFTEGWRID